MVRLLVYRVAPLLIRPAAIFLEGLLPGSPTVLVLSLPIAMMALMLSSVPLHLDYYKSRKGDANHKQLANQYISGLTWVILISLIVLSIVMSIPALGFESLFTIIVCLTFVIEKLSDESSRALEFRKHFFGWFCVQMLRSGWVLVPLLVGFVGLSYDWAYFLVSCVCVLMSMFVFARVSELRPSLNTSGLLSISRNMAYFFGSILPASYRQAPRILIGRLYPEQAHLFVSLAQIAQGVGIIFNVRFQIPYRKIIALKTILFQKRLEPVMRKILMIPILVIFLYALGGNFLSYESSSKLVWLCFVAPVVVSDSILFSVLSAHLGYIQWSSDKVSAVRYYLLCIAIGLFMVGVLVHFDIFGRLSIVGIPLIGMLVGFVWLLLAKYQFFATSNTKEI